uniref:Uncharacterized protein n=1 Tax=Arundo donax TaxID=35708 RepID=A0A0A9HSM4_ARUDO
MEIEYQIQLAYLEKLKKQSKQ